MLDIFYDNMFIMFDRLVFHHTIGIPMGTNYASILADYLLLALLKRKDRILVQTLNSASAI
jgi:hypothetical protein